MSAITIAISGPNVQLSTLARALDRTNSLLDEIGQSLGEINSSENVAWEIAGLQFGSASVTVRPSDEHATKGANVLQTFRLGFLSLETNSSRPRGYSNDALEIVKQISKLNITYTVEDSESSETFPVSQNSAANAQKLLSERARRTYIGSIEGVVELMSGFQEYFAVEDKASGRKIRCECDKDTLSQIAAQAWEKRICVSGEVTVDPFGRPQSIKVNRYKIFKDQAILPSPEDMLGIYKKA